ncbi:hypothetical protein [Halorubrum sp. Boch-26]|uniref:hypothetical protein n=1 Tax=Halorubrum sp. Boch-26 TaxID=2994426 RepID=UPI0024697150|nr:hypothetical protein [Halorubrum sp. Boch-26]
MSFLGGSEPEFDDESDFVPEHVPEPGAFLTGHDVLAGEGHVVVHEHAADAFEEHGVYDATFGYNLARLTLDPRHPDAGFRYAEETERPTTLRAEFTPTTAFCPQAEPLAVGAFRALDAVDDHGYDLVRVRVDPSLNGSEAVNDRLERLESGDGDPGGAERADADRPDATGGDANGPPSPF